MAILVTGGAGYIGSHTARQLVESGEKVVVLDNLYSGHRWAVPEAADFYEGDVGDPKLVSEIIAKHGVDSVVHFAAHLVAPESVTDPLKYYENNTVKAFSLIKTCYENNVRQFIFSSTCAVYGQPKSTEPVRETDVPEPLSPYGASKLATERILQGLSDSSKLNKDAKPFRYVALRYFNVAGASLDGTLGQATPGATQLVKVAGEAAMGLRKSVSIFGTDYPTRDGTGIRDYIHVEDLAKAHLHALTFLQKGGDSEVFNCGYGHGFSVREVLDAMKKATEIDFTVEEKERRPGDPAEIQADSSKIRELLKWEPQYDDINLICKTSYEWEKKLIEKNQ